MKIYMKFNSKYIFNYFIVFYSIILIILSLNVGITHDEPHHDLVWQINKKIYSNYLLGSNYNIRFEDYGSNFYGIGFQLFSFPIELIIKLLFKIFGFNEINPYTIKHPSVSIFFIISGIFLKKILDVIIKKSFYPELVTIVYLLYPYLYGHSFFNTLDIPFMCIWLACSFILVKICQTIFFKKDIRNIDILILSLLTAFLLSIRISGILIFFQFFLFLIFLKTFLKTEFRFSLKYYLKKIGLFFLVLAPIFYLLHPNYWDNPLKVIEAINYMRSHIQTVCTVTLGECMPAQNLPPSYIFIWLFFKLPLIILFGLFIFPLVEKKIFQRKFESYLLFSLISSTLLIIFLLIIFNVNLYDELRQVLFLIPLIFIISTSFIYFYSKKILLILSIFFILFFSVQNIKLFPYNYIWLNNFTSLLNINNKFELDYWGVSTKNIAHFINNQFIDENECIISNRSDGIKYFITNKKVCLKQFSDLHKNNLRPFYVALSERFLRKGVPNKCILVKDEYIKMNFSNNKLILAKIFKCIN